MKKSRFWFWLFVGPILLAFLTVVIIPMLRGFYFSFAEWNGISNDVNLVGLDNYIRAFQDEEFINSFKFTAKFAAVSVVAINAIGFGLALLVTQGLKGANIQRSIFFMPT